MNRWLQVVVVLCFIAVLAGPAGAEKLTSFGEIALGGSFAGWKLGHEDMVKHFNFYLKAGRTMASGLGIEAEGMGTKYEDSAGGFMLSGSLTYNRSLETNTTCMSNFVLLGYGLSNALPISGSVSTSGSGKQSWWVISAGVGTRILLASPVALRIEYRYLRYRAKDVMDAHLGLVGFSLIIPES
jgi:opacity protein-like surface antigen